MRLKVVAFLFAIFTMMSVVGGLTPKVNAADDVRQVIIDRTAGNCTSKYGGEWDSAKLTCFVKSCDVVDGKSLFGFPNWYKYLEGEIVSGKCKPILGSSDTEPTSRIMKILPIGLGILDIMLRLGGIVAVVMVFVGSFKYVLSQGESDQTAGARKTVVNAMIGLVIIIVATRLVSFIGGRLG